jgi:hypothetical protein
MPEQERSFWRMIIEFYGADGLLIENNLYGSLEHAI